MKRERPPMPPLSVRAAVADRQVRQMVPTLRIGWYLGVHWDRYRAKQLAAALEILKFSKPCLDHDPALILREYDSTILRVADRYTPHAHDPDFLIYREKADHQQKTTGRKPGAERTVTTKGSDIWLKSKFARLEGRTKQRPKQKIRSRGFQPRG
jgi:hypothetical protein